jgi:hypothetical protein
MKNIFVIVVCGLLSIVSYAQSSSINLAIPAPAQSFQADRFRAGELDCSNAIGGGTNVEFGVTGVINNVNGSPLDGGGQGKDVGVYARITIPLDGPSERINCNTLYELELEKKRMEIQKLQQELNNLKKLQFAN